MFGICLQIGALEQLSKACVGVGWLIFLATYRSRAILQLLRLTVRWGRVIDICSEFVGLVLLFNVCAGVA